MSERLWDKGGASDAAMMRYTARDDWQLDQPLLIHDLRATAAHVHGLGRIGVLDAEESKILDEAIKALMDRCGRGELTLSADDEDCHSAIEAALIEAVGELGKKVHTGRSRNDQVLVALRLYERDAIDSIVAAARRAGIVLLDAIDALGAARLLAGGCPLGAAAGYGVNLPLDHRAEISGFTDEGERRGVVKMLGRQFKVPFAEPGFLHAVVGVLRVSMHRCRWPWRSAGI